MSRPHSGGTSAESKGASDNTGSGLAFPSPEKLNPSLDTSAKQPLTTLTSLEEDGPDAKVKLPSSGPGADTVEPVKEHSQADIPTPETMLRDLSEITNSLASLMSRNPATANEEFHAAALPTYEAGNLMKGRSKVSAPAATKEWTSDLIGEVEQAFKTIDAIQDIANKPSIPSTAHPQSASSSTAAGSTPGQSSDYLGQLGSLFRAFNAPSHSSISPPSNSLLGPQVLQDVGRKSIITNPVILQLGLHQLATHLQQLSPNEPQYVFCQSVFGLLLLHLYELTFKDEHLDGGVSATSMALSAVDMNDPGIMLMHIPMLLTNYAYGQRLLVQEDGDISKLDAAVTLLTTAWNIYKDIETFSQHAKGLWRSELGACLFDRYRATGVIGDLNSAIEHLQMLSEQGHKVPSLGLAYYERFLHLGNLDDLDRALHQSRTEFTGGDPLMPSRVSRPEDLDEIMGRHLYGLVLAQRFNMTLDTGDLDRAIESCRNALAALNPSHPLKSHWQADPAWISFTRSEAHDELEDLRSAKEMIQSAIQTFDKRTGKKLGRHTRIPFKAVYGYFLCLEGEKRQDLAEVEEGIRLLTTSRKEFSGPLFLESRIEYYISEAYLAQFKLTKKTPTKLEILPSAIHHATLAFDKASENSPHRFYIGLYLGNVLIINYELTKLEDSLHNAIAHLRKVALSTTWPSIRLEAAVKWADAADLLGGDGTINALEVALSILPSLAWAGNRMPVQFRMLQAQQSGVATRAVIHALDVGDVAKAVGYLEQGRNIIWAQSLQLRSKQLTTEDRRDQEQKYLSRFLSQQQHASRAPRLTRSNLSQNSAETMKMLEERGAPPEFQNLLKSLGTMYSQTRQRLVDIAGPEQVERDFAAIDQFKADFTEAYKDASLHNAARRWEELWRSVEEVDGMLSSALRNQHQLNTSDTELVRVLQRGSIVILNTYGSRCDAIVISTNEASIDFHHVPLRDVTGDEAISWAETIRQGLYDVGQGDMAFPDFEEAILIPILQGLWNGVARPVLEYLNERKTPKRVWWYPTGSFAFLPIHAASPCEGDAPGAMELVVSSYIPSIHSLIRAHRSPRLSFRILAVGQPNTPGHGALAFVEKELNSIQHLLKKHPDSLTHIVGEDATTYMVMKSLPEHTAFHYAGHAKQDEAYPFHSAFLLHDGPFQLSQLMNLDLSRVQFAFLSACLISSGDFTLPDECIHLAAGMQFAGVRSLVATSWSVEDRAASMVTSRVYKELLKNGLENAQAEDTAEALHLAILNMKQAKVPLTLLVPFIHLGM